MASIFLSHSSEDNEIAADLSRRLKEHGYDSLFLDIDPDSGIRAGRDWERELYRNLKLARAVIVLCSPTSMASRWCFVEIAQAKALGKAIFPIKFAPCEIESILADRQVIDASTVGKDDAFRRLIEGLREAGLDPWDSFQPDPTRPPFPGLNYFDTKDAGMYFGREDEVRQVIEMLTRMQCRGEPRLLVVLGSSGSGKSSLVRAGVLPRLEKDRSHWVLIDPFRPGVAPVSELARALCSAFPSGSARPDWKAIRDRLKEEFSAEPECINPAGLTTSVLSEYADELSMALSRREASVLFVVDQAEELLQSGAGDKAVAFLNVIRRAMELPGGRVFGLLTLRSDFLGSFQNHAALRGISFSDLPIGLLPVERFPQVIEGPASRAEIGLEPGLVHSMIADARTDDALPLLAFTLREMFERCRDQERLTLKVYRDDLGGIKGAVARVVNRIKTETAWSPQTGRALRRAFLKLVRVNDEGQFTRHSCRWADLPDLAAHVLEAFVKARLLSSNGDVVEVTHESLFRVWPELAGWLDESRELMLWKKNIQIELKDWDVDKRSPDRLLTGARLAEARRWLASNADDFAADETEFLTASITADDHRIAREQAQQARLRRLTRSLAVGVTVASLLAVLAIGMGGYALMKREQANKAADLAKTQTMVAQKATEKAKAQTKAAREAEEKEKNQRVIADAATKKAIGQTIAAENATKKAEVQAKIATSRQLAALSMAVLNKRFDRSLLLAVAAVRAADTLEARSSLYRALRDRPGLTAFLHINEGTGSCVAFSPDGRTIAAAYGGAKTGDKSSGGGAVLWDATTRKRVTREPLPVTEGYATSVAFRPDGKTIAAGYSTNIVGHATGVVLWDVTTHKRLVDEPIPVNEGSVISVAFSPDGKTIAAGYLGHGSGRGGVVLWHAATLKRLVEEPIVVIEGPVWSVAFSPDGKTLAAGCHSGVVLWDVATWQRLTDEPLPVKEGRLTSVAFSPDSQIVAGGYELDDYANCGGGLVLWNSATHKRLLVDPLAVKEGNVRSVAFSPDGKTIAATYGNNGISDCEGGVVFWDAAAYKRLVGVPIQVTEGRVESVAFSPDGKTIAAAYDDGATGGVALCNATARDRLSDEPFPVKEGRLTSVAFSPDSQIVAGGYELDDVANSGGGLVLWNAATHKRATDEPLLVKEGLVQSVAFNPDGKTIAAGYAVSGDGASGGVALWDVASRKRLVDEPILLKEGPIVSVAFSPDGNVVAAGYVDEHRSGGGVVVWDATTHKRLVDEPLRLQGGFFESLAFSADGKTIAGASTDLHHIGEGGAGGVVLWDATTHKRLVDEPFVVKESLVRSVAFSPDGKTLAAGCDSGVVLWDVATWRRLTEEPLSVDGRAILSVALSPDGKTLAAAVSGSRDHKGGGIILWDAYARRRLVDVPLRVIEGSIERLAFSPNGKTIAGVYSVRDGDVDRCGLVMCNVDLESWQLGAGGIANRNFTEKEWRQYFGDEPYHATFPDLPVRPAVTPK